MAKTTLAQRLQTIMDATGWSQAELGRRTKISRQNINNWMQEVAGSKKNIEPKFAFQIQDATRFNARWVIYGEGPARMDIADADDTALFQAISKLPPDRKKALVLALGLSV